MNPVVGVDQIRKRATNRGAILREVHLAGPLRRTELSRRLNIRKSSVTSIAAELVNQGVMTEDNPRSQRSRLSLNDGRCAMVTLVDVNEIHLARVKLNGTIGDVTTTRYDATLQPAAVLEILAGLIKRDLVHSRDDVLGVGVAMPGVVNASMGVAIFSANLRRWREVPVRQVLEDRLGAGVYVNNDVRSQLWSAAWFDRHLREIRNMMYVGVTDVGVAGTMIVRGHVVAGHNSSAGEFGHVRAGDDGRLCGCGKTDCLEAYCSVSAMISEVTRVRPDLSGISTAAGVADWALRERAVMNVLDRIVARLAQILAPILAAVDPEALLLGSPSASLTKLLLDLLRRHLDGALMGLGARHVRLIAAGGDRAATLRGIGGLVIDRSFRTGRLQLSPLDDAGTILIKEEH